jgi:hypothetical protein
MKYTFVTAFNKEHFDVYAKKMLQSVVDNWSQDDFKLIVYYDGYGCQPYDKPDAPEADFIEYRNLDLMKAHNDFIERNKDKNGRFAEAPYNYRMDAIRFCHKVYAYTDLAYELIDQEYKGWMVWLDADTITTKKFTAEDAAKILPDEADVVHLGRIDIDYSETGFVGWNMGMHNAASMLVDIRGAYDTDEIFGYREWTDSFIFERLLNIYKAHGTHTHNLSEGVRGLAVFENSVLKDYFIHNKGNLKFDTSKLDTVAKDVKGPKRYKQLADMVRHYSEGLNSFSIVETGTWNGGRAIEMALAAFENVDAVHYRGFDLFEDATDETDKIELNIKQHNTYVAINDRLRQFSNKMKENSKVFTFTLYKGDTKKTMEAHQFNDVDLAYIDGGHSYDTVSSDYKHLSNVPVVVFDDYYNYQEEDKEVPEEHAGIIKTFKEAKDKNKYILPSQDMTAFGSNVHLAVLLDKDTKPLPNELIRTPIIIKPKDCMPSDYIRNNIKENLGLVNDYDWVKKYKPTDDHVAVVSGGTIDFKSLKRIRKKHDAQIWCVKHALPKLLEQGITPDACLVLDPRPIEGISTHGVKRTELFENIPEETTFYIASMTDPSVTRHIMSKTDKIKGFHAFTDGIRDPSVTDKVVIDTSTGISNGALLISGGTAAATRTIGLLDTLGYHNIHLFGFDCSIVDITDEQKEQKDEEGRPKYIHVETGGEKFYTTGELLALAQDLEKMFEEKALQLNLRYYGKNSLVSQLWEQSFYKNEYRTFMEEECQS